MSTRKNIDKLYLGKFEGAEMPPPEDAWENIVSRLPKEKKQKRLIPLWFRYAGVAALFLMLLTFSRDFFSPEAGTPVVNSSVTRQDIHKEIRLSSSGFTETMLEVSMMLQDIMQKENGEVGTSKRGAEGKTGNSALALTDAAPTLTEQRNIEEKTVSYPPNPESADSQLTSIAESTFTSEKREKSLPELKEETILTAVASGEDTGVKNEGDLPTEEFSEENAIASQLNEELKAAKENPEEDAKGRISLSTRVAPVFYENRGGGDAMGASMGSSEASGEISVSYGIHLAYQISDRVKIRTGISKLDLSFSTPGVPMAAVMKAGNFIDETDPSLVTSLVRGELQQQMDFIEFPLEMEYRLVDRRIGLNLIGGASTLFLNKNNLRMDTGIRSTDLGKAEDLQKLNFSANVGLGLDYQLAPQFRLSLEPMFKYQLNSMSDETGVQPYYMAIYSGLSISF